MRGNLLATMLLVGGMVFLAPGIPLLAQSPGAPQSMGQQRAPSSNPTLTQQAPIDTTRMQSKVDDKKFVRDAAMGGMIQIELGKLAAEKGSSDSVRQFGQKMVDDHTKTNEELKKLAAAESIDIPDSVNSKHQSRVDKLSKLSGTAFDKAYIKDQVKDHEQDVRDFQDEAHNGSDAAVKDFAAKTMPALQGHLAMAKDLKNGKSTSDSADRSKQ